jgi:hypothetical protein
VSAALALPLLVQLLGLNVLCFCGHCPASAILVPAQSADQPVAVVEHACCHHADAAPETDANSAQWTSQSCCGDDHLWRPATALVPTGHPPLPAVTVFTLPVPPPLTARAFPYLRPIPPQFLARGPPPVPLYLRDLSLQI